MKSLERINELSAPKRDVTPAFSGNKNEPVHRWVPWIAGFSSDFVQKAFQQFLNTGKVNTVLDPFAGVGTTLVEAIRSGYHAVGFEINPYAVLAAKAKIEILKIKPRELSKTINAFKKHHEDRNAAEPTSSAPSTFRSRVPFFSPKILPRFLHSLDFVRSISNECHRDIFNLALGSVMVSFSNYSYEPSLTTRRGVGRADVLEAPVEQIVVQKLLDMLADIRMFQTEIKSLKRKPQVSVYKRSFMEAQQLLKPATVDLIVTSPPYLNNYHYIRNTRPQLHWLGLYEPGLLEHLENNNVGKFWQTVRESPEINLAFKMPRIEQAIESVRAQNKDRGIYGGGGWANYAASYYNDTYQFLSIFKWVLRRGGTAVIVIGNSIIQGINIQVDQHIGEIAEMLGLRLVEIVTLRTKRVGSSIVDSSVRRAENTKASLYESAVVIRKK